MTAQSIDWANTAAQTALDRAKAARQGRADTHAGAARLKARVQTDGIEFFRSVEAELRTAAAAFNARIGRIVLDVARPHDGPIAVTARSVEGAGFVSVVPLLSTDDRAPAPGAIATERRHGRESRTPYDFVLDGEALRLRCAGEALAPDAFARHALAPWLASINLPGAVTDQ